MPLFFDTPGVLSDGDYRAFLPYQVLYTAVSFILLGSWYNFCHLSVPVSYYQILL